MKANTKRKAYKHNVILWIYFFCLGASVAGIGASITTGFSGGALLGFFVVFFILWFILAEMKKVD